MCIKLVREFRQIAREEKNDSGFLTGYHSISWVY